MEEKIFTARILNKNDTHENWTTNNPVLRKGEIASVTLNGQTYFKVGDGSSTYNELNFSSSFTDSNGNVIVDTYATNDKVKVLEDRLTADTLYLADAITGTLYAIQIQNGQLVSFIAE